MVEHELEFFLSILDRADRERRWLVNSLARRMNFGYIKTFSPVRKISPNSLQILKIVVSSKVDVHPRHFYDKDGYLGRVG